MKAPTVRVNLRMPNVPSVLVVGGGLTSAAVSRALRRQLPVESVTVWEALGSLGGRMHTERASVQGVVGLADTGAQYVTVTDDAGAAAAHKPLYDQLLESGVLRPMTGRIEGKRSADGGGTNYVAPQGVATIVEHMFSSSEIAPSLGRQAVGLRRVPPDGSLRGRWEVSSSDGQCHSFDGVVVSQLGSPTLSPDPDSSPIPNRFRSPIPTPYPTPYPIRSRAQAQARPLTPLS